MKRTCWSLSVRIVVLVCCIVFPVIAAMMLSNIYAITVVKRQVALSNQNTVALYMQKLDRQLRDISLHIASLSANNEDVIILNSCLGQNETILARIRLTRKFNEYLVISKPISGFFYLNNAANVYVSACDPSIEYEEMKAMQTGIGGICDGFSLRELGKWNCVEENGEYYFVVATATVNGYLGAWVKVESLMEELNQGAVELRGSSVFVTNDGTVLTGDDDIRTLVSEAERDGGKRYLMAMQRSGVMNVTLMSVVESRQILDELPELNAVMIIISAAAVCAVAVLALSLRGLVMRPMNTLINAMDAFGKGKIDTRITAKANSSELETAFQGFNSMAEEIKTLKINVYEERLNIEKVKLQYYKLQIDPHFYMNCINIIHSLAVQEDYVLIQEMSQLLVRYLRQMFAADMGFTTLSDELAHVEVYLKITALRYPGRFKYDIRVPEFLEHVPVPRLLVMTFAENSAKYGVSAERILEMQISAQVSLLGNEPAVSISIRDNGGGFPPEVLEHLRRDERLYGEGREHIGINNVRRRLELLYGRRYGFELSNMGGGAEIRITVPLKPETKLGDKR